ncbi:MAG: hypothetical protein ACUVR1_04415, partial [Fimbriimonadales bacterium]
KIIERHVQEIQSLTRGAPVSDASESRAPAARPPAPSRPHYEDDSDHRHRPHYEDDRDHRHRPPHDHPPHPRKRRKKRDWLEDLFDIFD